MGTLSRVQGAAGRTHRREQPGTTKQQCLGAMDWLTLQTEIKKMGWEKVRCERGQHRTGRCLSRPSAPALGWAGQHWLRRDA